MLTLLLSNVGLEVSRETLRKTANVHDWQRSLRSLRQEGWNIESTRKGYILHSETKSKSIKKRENINAKLRYAVFHRDNSTCQRCGKSIEDGVKLQADHKIPVEWGGRTDLDNLWTLCSECNGGKKHFFSDLDADVMKKVIKEENGYRRMLKYFQLKPNQLIEPIVFEIISGIRDWTRTLRLMREKEKMNITWHAKSEKYKKGGYIYNKD